MKILKLIAVDVDGVLLKDTYSPVLHKMFTDHNIDYTREIERNMFSRPRDEGTNYFKKKFNVDENVANENLIKAYFVLRQQYIDEHGSGLLDGVPAFLEMLTTLKVKLVCYGGLEKSYIEEDMGEYLDFFEKYICTNDFRPGLKEITKDIYNYEFNEVLFIDDVNTVAENAKDLNVPFIGVPSGEPWSWQKKDMVETGVKYIVQTVKDIDINMIMDIDKDALTGDFWKKK